MKKLLLLLLVIPFFAMSQDKNVVSTFRVFAKPGKTADFENALIDHVKKYHTGDWSWHVFEVVSGPDAGAYQITEGPSNWTVLDGRGDISPEHDSHWNNVVNPLTEDAKGGHSYSVYQKDLSTTGLTDWTNKISITHLYLKPGCMLEVENNLKKAKKAWEANGEIAAVYLSHFSGQPQYIIVYRHKTGWKEKETGFRKPFPETFQQVYGGPAELDKYLKIMRDCVDHVSGEMLEMRSDLSSVSK